MNVRELRQGNLIFGLYENEDSEEIYKTECSFLGFNPFDNYIFVDSKAIGFDEFVWFEPITLTEEWLLKFGFKTHENYFWYKKGNVFSNMLSVAIQNKDGVITIIENVNHVHSLQNLYFALTGEELTLNNVV